MTSYVSIRSEDRNFATLQLAMMKCLLRSLNEESCRLLPCTIPFFARTPSAFVSRGERAKGHLAVKARVLGLDEQYSV